jgi:hypothetical protein
LLLVDYKSTVIGCDVRDRYVARVGGSGRPPDDAFSQRRNVLVPTKFVQDFVIETLQYDELLVLARRQREQSLCRGCGRYAIVAGSESEHG